MVFQLLFHLTTNQLKVGDSVSDSVKEKANLRGSSKAVEPSKTTVQDTAKHYLKINQLFKNIYNIDLVTALARNWASRVKNKGRKKEETTRHREKN